MSRDYSAYLRDILSAADEIAAFLRGIESAEHLASDQMRLYAIAYALQISGEAAKNIPQAVRERHTEVAWRGATGLRDVIAHAYFKLDASQLWSIIQSDVPLLRAQIAAILNDSSSENK